MVNAALIGVALLLAVVGFALGRAGGRGAGRDEGRRQALAEGKESGVAEGRAEAEKRMRALADAIRGGGLPDAAAGSAEADVRRALEAGWTPREQERQRALREAIGRVSGFLDAAVRAPLSAADGSTDADELRERIEQALGSLQDLEFFLTEPGSATEGRDLVQLTKQVTHEFAADQGVPVRLRLDGKPARADLNPQGFMDGLYLILHNASRFGGDGTVDVTVVSEGGRARVKVRDRGPGFSEEAFTRAFDPFYSTAPDGLGLGLPHARRTIEAMGGEIELRNVPDGGAEVEVSFPSA